VASISKATRLWPQTRALNESSRERVNFGRIMEKLLNGESSYPVWLAKAFVRKHPVAISRGGLPAFINADLIAQGHSPFNSEAATLCAARLILEMIEIGLTRGFYD